MAPPLYGNIKSRPASLWKHKVAYGAVVSTQLSGVAPRGKLCGGNRRQRHFWRLLVWFLCHPCLCFAELLKPRKSSGLMAAYVGGGRRNNHAQQHRSCQVCDCPCSSRLCFHSLSTCDLLPKARQKAELTRALRCTQEGFMYR